jgi:hypothetical protein
MIVNGDRIAVLILPFYTLSSKLLSNFLFFLQLAAEVRIPIKGTHVYAFAEHGTDLGSSKDVKGNPTEVYRRMGQGSSYGAGMKLGLVRAEYAVDHNSGTGAIFFRFGERF